jgi:hypothetical protein
MRNAPAWVVIAQFFPPESKKWVATSWEFFPDEASASKCYDRHEQLGHCSTKRPYYDQTDRVHMNYCDAMNVATS